MEVIHIICNMCFRDLPDMYALSPWDMYGLSPRALGIHIRQIPCPYITTIM